MAGRICAGRWVPDRAQRRRVSYSLKVASALTLVSLTVLLPQILDFGMDAMVGDNAMWAIFTVVFVFEFTVGATLSKGLNRGLGTIAAALLGFTVDSFANFLGPAIEPYVVGSSIFIIGTVATYTRMNPTIKAKFDYGVVMFLLTFCLVVVHGYRAPSKTNVVLERIVTVALGVAICLVVSMLVFPIWAGDDLHRSIVEQFESLADSLEGCVKEYFHGAQRLARLSSKIRKGQPYDDKIYQGYRGVLISKQTHEHLGALASWEPRCGRFGCTYPWKQLVDVGAVLQHCACTLSALHGCVVSEIQAPLPLKQVFARCSMQLGEEAAAVLRRLAHDLDHGYRTPPKRCLLHGLHREMDDLKRIATNIGYAIDDSHVNPNSNPNPNPNPNPRPSNASTSAAQLGPCPGPTHNPNPNPNNLEPHPIVECATVAGSVFVVGLVTLLIELVARLDCLVDVVAVFQEKARFREVCMDDEVGASSSHGGEGELFMNGDDDDAGTGVGPRGASILHIHLQDTARFVTP